MLDHVTLTVSDLDRSIAFYDRALAPLAIERLYQFGETDADDGARPKAFFWIGGRGAVETRVHIAFAVADRATVDRFYAAALAAGGRDNGTPAVCPEYHPNYYGAFVLDPDGHNIEAVCHLAAKAASVAPA